MTSRISELEMRRQMLVLRSERLREELVVQNFALRRSIGGIDRVFSIARSVRSPLVIAGLGMVALRALRGGLRRTRKVGSVGWGVRAMMLVSVVRRALSLIQTFRAISRPRTY